MCAIQRRSGAAVARMGPGRRRGGVKTGTGTRWAGAKPSAPPAPPRRPCLRRSASPPECAPAPSLRRAESATSLSAPALDRRNRCESPAMQRRGCGCGRGCSPGSLGPTSMTSGTEGSDSGVAHCSGMSRDCHVMSRFTCGAAGRRVRAPRDRRGAETSESGGEGDVGDMGDAAHPDGRRRGRRRGPRVRQTLQPVHLGRDGPHLEAQAVSVRFRGGRRCACCSGGLPGALDGLCAAAGGSDCLSVLALQLVQQCRVLDLKPGSLRCSSGNVPGEGLHLRRSERAHGDSFE